MCKKWLKKVFENIKKCNNEDTLRVIETKCDYGFNKVDRIEEKMGDITMSLNQMKEEVQSIIKDLSKSKDMKIRPSDGLWLIPVLVFIAFGILLLIPLKCTGQCVCPECPCHIKDTGQSVESCPVCKTETSITINDSVNKILTKTHDYIYLRKSVHHFIEDPQSKKDRLAHVDNIYHSTRLYLYLYLVIIAILFFVAILYLIKHLVPYWERVAELNYKLKERRLIDELRREQDKLDNEMLGNKTRIELLEKYIRMQMEEDAKNAENNRKIAYEKERRSSSVD